MSLPESFRHQTWRPSPDLIGFADMDGRFIETNPAWQATLGWSSEEMHAMTYLDVLHPGDVEATVAVFEELKRGRPLPPFENRYRCKDGSYRWLSWVAASEDDVVLWSARDVTREREGPLARPAHRDEAPSR